MQAAVPLGPLQCGPLTDNKESEQAGNFQLLIAEGEGGKVTKKCAHSRS